MVNIHQAKTQLSKLIDQAVKGDPFVIAKAGKPLVKVTRLDQPKTKSRLGFLTTETRIPADFDRMGQSEIERLWAAAQPEKLPRKARAIFDDTSKELLFSTVSLWEMTQLTSGSSYRLPQYFAHVAAGTFVAFSGQGLAVY